MRLRFTLKRILGLVQWAHLAEVCSRTARSKLLRRI